MYAIKYKVCNSNKKIWALEMKNTAIKNFFKPPEKKVDVHVNYQKCCSVAKTTLESHIGETILQK